MKPKKIFNHYNSIGAKVGGKNTDTGFAFYAGKNWMLRAKKYKKKKRLPGPSQKTDKLKNTKDKETMDNPSKIIGRRLRNI